MGRPGLLSRIYRDVLILKILNVHEFGVSDTGLSFREKKDFLQRECMKKTTSFME